MTSALKRSPLDAATSTDAGAVDVAALVLRWAEAEQRQKVDPTPANAAAASRARAFATRARGVGPARADVSPDDPRAQLRTEGLTGTEFLKLWLPPLVFLDEHNLVPADHVVVPISAPNVGKTFLACEIVLSTLARGHRVVCYQQEGIVQKFQDRIARAAAAHLEANLDNLLVKHGSDVNLLEEDGIAAVLETLESFRPQLTVFDSLAACADGLDENHPGEMGQVANNLHRVRGSGHTAVFAPHHMTKEGWKEGAIPSLRNMRGHSSLAGRVDVSYGLTPVTSDTPEMELAFDLYDLKQRDAAKIQARRCTVAMPGSGPVASFRMFDVDKAGELAAAKAEKTNRRVNEIAAAMLEELRHSRKGLESTKLRAAVDGRNEDKAAALKLLKTSRKIVRDEDAERWVLVGLEGERR